MTSELAVVAEFCSPVEATVFQEELEEAGIACYLDNTQVSDAFGQLKALGGVKIQVATADRERAEQIIAAVRLRAQEATGVEVLPAKTAPAHQWTCLQCGEFVENRYQVCWSCGASREGVPDPEFRSADDTGEDDRSADYFKEPGEVSGSGVRLTVAVVLLILGTLVFLADAARGHSQWLSIVVWLAMWGVAAALWPKKESGSEP